MQYLLMIYHAEEEETKLSEAETAAMHAAYGQFTHSIRESGSYIGGNALQPTATATTVRVRDGKTLATDGPFAETREQLGGYYLINAEHLDDAIGIAARIPGAKAGSIEIRPIWSIPATASA
jgi:hypothetical protein